MRGLLIVNPQATTTTGNSADLVIRSLAGLVDLDVEHTRYRGHARELAAAARDELVIVLGGDGAINEAVNGIMARPPGQAPGQGPGQGPGSAPGQAEAPLLAVIPAAAATSSPRRRAPADAAAASQAQGIVDEGRPGPSVSAWPAAGTSRPARAWASTPRWCGRSTAARQRHQESPARFLQTMLRQYRSGTDRRTPALTLEHDGQPSTPDLFMTAITNRCTSTICTTVP